MTPKQQLCIPGPTPVPDRVLRAACRPMIYPRGPEFATLLDDCLEGLRWALQTESNIVLFPASGTGGLEAAVMNLCRPGTRALFCVNGYFSELWATIAQRAGTDLVRVQAPWGWAVDPSVVRRTLEDDPQIDIVFVAHAETSTGVLNDIAAIAALAREHDALIAVDSISGAPCHPLPVDNIGIDVVVTASQKGWLAPPGLTMVTLSPAAEAVLRQGECRSLYFDFARQLAHQRRGMFPMTPPLSIMYALREGLEIMREEGLPQLWRRHELVSQALRTGLEETGLSLVARGGAPSRTVTVARSPFSSPVELDTFLTALREEHGLVLAEGLGLLYGASFRIGHLGTIRTENVREILAAIERCLWRDARWNTVANGRMDNPPRVPSVSLPMAAPTATQQLETATPRSAAMLTPTGKGSRHA